jgi:hypothetical protein
VAAPPAERLAVELRLEFFKTLNRTSFSIPDQERMQIFTVDGVREDAGRITSALPSREIQLGQDDLLGPADVYSFRCSCAHTGLRRFLNSPSSEAVGNRRR